MKYLAKARADLPPETLKNRTPLVDIDPQVLDKLRNYGAAALRDSTKRQYQSALNAYLRSGYPLPAQALDVANYLEHAHALRKVKGGGWKATDKPLSISACEVALAALSFYHRQEHFEHPDPTQHELVRRALDTIRKQRAKPKDQARALSLEELHRMVDAARATQNHAHRHRDAALLLVGFYGALRRSELTSIEYAHLRFDTDQGIALFIPRSKTDAGNGAIVPIPATGGTYCPVQAVKHWLDYGKITRGAVFRAIDRWGWMSDTAISPEVVGDILRKHARKANISLDKLRSHSLRAGCITETLRADGGLENIAEHARHSNPTTTMGYYRRDEKTRLAEAPTRALQQNEAQFLGRLKKLWTAWQQT